MKKLMAICMVLILITGVFTGCSSNGETEKGTKYNKEFSKEKMITVSGEELDLNKEKDVFANKALGFGFVKPGVWKDIDEDKLSTMVLGISEYSLGYLPSEQVEFLKSLNVEELTEEEINKILKEMYEKKFDFLCIYRVNEDNSETKERVEEIKKQYSDIIELGAIDKDSYFIAYNSELPSEDLADKDKKEIQALIESIDELQKNMILFPPILEDENKEFEGDLKSFETVDVNGKAVTQDILKDYDITMVNIWTTWCGFCVEEMPELQELYKGLPENVNMITICGDAADEPELTKEILTASKAEFTTLQGNKDLEKSVLQYVTGFPTTIFVDSKGNVIGAPQVGAPAAEGEIVEGYTKLINDALSKIGK